MKHKACWSHRPLKEKKHVTVKSYFITRSKNLKLDQSHLPINCCVIVFCCFFQERIPNSLHFPVISTSFSVQLSSTENHIPGKIHFFLFPQSLLLILRSAPIISEMMWIQMTAECHIYLYSVNSWYNNLKLSSGWDLSLTAASKPTRMTNENLY